jgi:hypothetical protein
LFKQLIFSLHLDVIKKHKAYTAHLLLFNLKLKRMARAMFEYTKTVLSKVSFDSTLFCKELQKALQRLLPYEIEELKIYIKSLILQNPELDQCLILLKA